MLLLAGVYAAAAARVDDTPLSDRGPGPPPRAAGAVPGARQPPPQEGAVRDPRTFRDVVGERIQRRFEREVNEESLRQLRTAGVAGVVGLALVSLVIGWFVAGRVLSPVARITQRARELGDEVPDLSGRIGLGGPHDELRELADTLDGFLDRTQAAVESQRRFLADASHELRTPIAAAKTSLEVAVDDPDADPAELREAIAVAERQLDRMGRIVGDLLVMERAAAAPQPHLDAGADLRAVVRETAASLEGAARVADVTLVVGKGPPVRCAMGPEAASRVVGNLLDNAVTYNRPGGTVEVTLEQAGDRVRLTVRDTGRGIPAEERARVFERFHRAARDVRGTGLGLAIVRELVTAAGGDIDLRSREGEGTTVIVHLPAAAPGR